MLDIPRIEPALLGQRLVSARKARGVTQNHAADHLGCSRPTLIAIEKGTRSAKPARSGASARLAPKNRKPIEKRLST